MRRGLSAPRAPTRLEAIRALDDEGVPIDDITVCERLRRAGHPLTCGIFALAIMDIWRSLPFPKYLLLFVPTALGA